MNVIKCEYFQYIHFTQEFQNCSCLGRNTAKANLTAFYQYNDITKDYLLNTTHVIKNETCFVTIDCDDVTFIGEDLISVIIALGNDAGFTVQNSILKFSKEYNCRYTH